ncbi:MAG: hypothetical protein MHM6MM_009632 [Cercozoa sp. M6MM]
MELLLTCCKALEQDETCRMATLGHLLCTWWKLSAAELMGTLSGATSRQKRALTDDTADLLAAPDDLKFAVRALSRLFLILPTGTHVPCLYDAASRTGSREPTWLLRSGHIL